MNNREAFEAWANTHGGLDLTVHEAMDNEKLSFPCTYYSYTTEIAWRAFANKKEPAQAALASQAAELSSNPLQLAAQAQQTELVAWGYAWQCKSVGDWRIEKLGEGCIPPKDTLALYTSQQEPVRPWICPNFMLPPRSEEVLVYPMPNNVAHTAFHDGECWRVTEYEDNYGYSLVALSDGFIKGWMPIPPAPEGDKPCEK